MRKSHEQSAIKRSAFTLIEILVVIAIIAILASLLLAAVVAVRGRIPVAKTQDEILQFSTGLNAFKSKYGFYPPDQVKLCSNRSSYGNTQLDTQSITAITKMFPNINWVGIMWDGKTLNTVTLQGDQSFFFFLGGVPDGVGNAPFGFLANPQYPAPSNTPKPPVTVLSSPDRIKFIPALDSSRIVLLHGNNFPSYLDGFSPNLPAATGTGLKQKQPYMYFSSMCVQFRENGYDTTPTTVPGAPAGVTISPYIQKKQTATTPTVYWNSATFQIISAGADGSFGAGGLWPSSPPQNHSMDDYSNFNSTVLASPD